MTKNSSIAYLGLEAKSVPAWERFLRDGVGVETAYEGDTLVGRIDDRAKRLIVRHGARDDVAFVGWHCGSEDEVSARLEPLRRRGVETTRGERAEADARGVEGFHRLRERNGLVFELAWGVRTGPPAATPLVPRGFVAGDLGLGHLALLTDDLEASSAEYAALLSARLSDHIEDRELGVLPVRIRFLHTNRRHHALALVKAPLPFNPLPRSIHHFAIEMASGEDVQRAYERMQKLGIPLARTIGQHPNDRITSFYVRSPSAFDVEIGAGGVTIDDESAWTPVEYDETSLWGHEVRSLPVGEMLRVGMRRAFGRTAN